MQNNPNGQPINIGMPFNFAEQLKNAQEMEGALYNEELAVRRALKRTAKWNTYVNFVLTNLGRIFELFNLESILKTVTNTGIKIVFAYIAYKEVMDSIEQHVLGKILDIVKEYYKAENSTNLVYLLATLVMLSFIFSYYGYKRKALEKDKETK